MRETRLSEKPRRNHIPRRRGREGRAQTEGGRAVCSRQCFFLKYVTDFASRTSEPRAVCSKAKYVFN